MSLQPPPITNVSVAMAHIGSEAQNNRIQPNSSMIYWQLFCPCVRACLFMCLFLYAWKSYVGSLCLDEKFHKFSANIMNPQTSMSSFLESVTTWDHEHTNLENMMRLLCLVEILRSAETHPSRPPPSLITWASVLGCWGRSQVPELPNWGIGFRDTQSTEYRQALLLDNLRLGQK